MNIGIEKLRLRIKKSQSLAASQHHVENIARLLRCFRAGVNDHPLQVSEKIGTTDAHLFAWKAGYSKRLGKNQNSLIEWQTARFLQGLNSTFLQ